MIVCKTFGILFSGCSHGDIFRFGVHLVEMTWLHIAKFRLSVCLTGIRRRKFNFVSRPGPNQKKDYSCRKRRYTKFDSRASFGMQNAKHWSWGTGRGKYILNVIFEPTICLGVFLFFYFVRSVSPLTLMTRISHSLDLFTMLFGSI